MGVRTPFCAAPCHVLRRLPPGLGLAPGALIPSQTFPRTPHGASDDFTFFRTPQGLAQRLQDVLALEEGIVDENRMDHVPCATLAN